MDFAKQVAWSLPIGIAFTDLVASVVKVEGPSMQPTFNPDLRMSSDWVIVEKISYKLLHNYHRGDVAVLWWVGVLALPMLWSYMVLEALMHARGPDACSGWSHAYVCMLACSGRLSRATMWRGDAHAWKLQTMCILMTTLYFITRFLTHRRCVCIVNQSKPTRLKNQLSHFLPPFRAPDDPHIQITKRLIGLERDVVWDESKDAPESISQVGGA